MGQVNIPGCQRKKGILYRRFRYRDAEGKRKDIYVPLPEPTDPTFAETLERVNAEYGTPESTRQGPKPGTFGALALEFRAAVTKGWTKKKRKNTAITSSSTNRWQIALRIASWPFAAQRKKVTW